MTQEELKRYKKVQLSFLDLHSETITDEYGIYSTGYFDYDSKKIRVEKEGGKLHLTVSSSSPIEYEELKEIRYKFLPNGIRVQVGQIYPPREDVEDMSGHCFHLWEI